MMKERNKIITRKKRIIILLAVCLVMLLGIVVWQKVVSKVTTDKEAIFKDSHEEITYELYSILEDDPELKALFEESIAMAAEFNPDPETNPVRTLDELYDFVDYSLTRMPWNILDDSRYESFATKCDQSILYIYYLMDQPLPELAGQDLFYNSIQYLEPVYTWLKDYNNTWKEYLDSEESWNDEYLDMLKADPKWHLDQGWYEDESNWHSFNDFFSRELSSADARPIAAPEDERIVTAPADSLPQGTWEIDEDGEFYASSINREDGVEIKASEYYNVADMLGEEGASFAQAFYGGTLTHTYLSYEDYHWYHMPVSGTVVACYLVPHRNAGGGIIYWDDERQLYVLESNSLSWQSYETRGCVIIDTVDYGLVAVLPIGMGQVSSVNFVPEIKVGTKVKKGDKLGYFLFGGSDCVMLFGPEAHFNLTAEKEESTDSYSAGYAHIYCAEQYGVMGE